MGIILKWEKIMRHKKRRATVTKKDLKFWKDRVGKRISKTVKLICAKQNSNYCKKNKGVWWINTTDIKIYTEEIRKQWICLLCKQTQEIQDER